MNPEQIEALQARRIVLMAEEVCLTLVKRKAQRDGDAELFLACANKLDKLRAEMREVEKPLYRLAAEERKRRNPPDNPLGI